MNQINMDIISLEASANTIKQALQMNIQGKDYLLIEEKVAEEIVKELKKVVSHLKYTRKTF